MAEDDDLRKEYAREDLGEGIRGKYYSEYLERVDVVALDPDATEASRETVGDRPKQV